MEVLETEVLEAAEPDGPAPSAPRRGRTAGLIAGAAALGVVAGACAGYVVQAGRPPTRLPSLSQPVVRQAEGDVAPLSAAEDRRVKTDGDLRKLLLKRPRGARNEELGVDGWMDVADYADTFDKPAGAFADLLTDEFRRAAVTRWQTGGTYTVEIRLVQYRQETKTAAAQSVEDQQYWSGRKPNTSSRQVPGTGDGMAYVHHTPRTEPGYLPQYVAEAQASRGDIVMEIWITDTRPIAEEKIMDLAERQVARL
ncbi:hypothetical protein ACWEN3_03245 [Streptomyces sp. NPDC004561]